MTNRRNFLKTALAGSAALAASSAMARLSAKITLSLLERL